MVRQSQQNKLRFSKDLLSASPALSFLEIPSSLVKSLLITITKKTGLCGDDRCLCEFMSTDTHFDCGVVTNIAITLPVITGSCD